MELTNEAAELPKFDGKRKYADVIGDHANTRSGESEEIPGKKKLLMSEACNDVVLDLNIPNFDFNIEDFSDEILFEILKNLDTWTLLTMMSLNNRFRTLILDSRFWQDIALGSAPLPLGILEDILERSHSRTQSMQLCGPTPTQQLDIEIRHFNNSLSKAFSDGCTLLSVLELKGVTIDFRKVPILRFPKSLRRLILTNCSVRMPKNAKSVFTGMDCHFTKLEELGIEENTWFDPYYMVIFSKLPVLRYLSLRGCQHLSEFVAYGSIAARFGFKKLEHLDLRFTPITNSDLQCFNAIKDLKVLLIEKPESKQSVGNNITDNETENDATAQLNHRCRTHYIWMDPLNDLGFRAFHQRSLSHSPPPSGQGQNNNEEDSTVDVEEVPDPNGEPNADLNINVNIHLNAEGNAEANVEANGEANAENNLSLEPNAELNAGTNAKLNENTNKNAKARPSAHCLVIGNGFANHMHDSHDGSDEEIDPNVPSTSARAAKVAAAQAKNTTSQSEPTASSSANGSASICCRLPPTRYCPLAPSTCPLAPTTKSCLLNSSSRTCPLGPSSSCHSTSSASCPLTPSTSSAAVLKLINSDSNGISRVTLTKSASSEIESDEQSSQSTNHSIDDNSSNEPNNLINENFAEISSPPSSSSLSSSSSQSSASSTLTESSESPENRSSPERPLNPQSPNGFGNAINVAANAAAAAAAINVGNPGDQEEVFRPRLGPHFIYMDLNSNRRSVVIQGLQRRFAPPPPSPPFDPFVANNNHLHVRSLNLVGNHLRGMQNPRTVTDRGILCFGRPLQPIIQNVIWIRIDNRPSNNSFTRLVIRNYDLVSDAALEHLAQCSPNLVYLDVTGTGVTVEGVRRFKQQKPDCEIIADHLIFDNGTATEDQQQ